MRTRLFGALTAVIAACWMMVTPASAQEAAAEVDSVESAAGAEDASSAADTTATAASAEERAVRPAPRRDASYELSLRELEDELNELKEDIYGSKARLFQLREQILNDPIGGSRMVVRLTNDIGARFRLVGATVALDGNQVFVGREPDDALDRMRGEVVFDGAVTPGPHNVAVRLEYEGNGFGVFSYMNGYTVQVTSASQVIVDGGMTLEVDASGYEDRSSGASYEERPSIRFETRDSETSAETLAEASEGEDEAL